MKKAIVILIIIIVLGIAGYVTYNRISNWEKERTNEVIKQEFQQKKIETLEEQVSNLQEELEEQEDKLVPKEKLAEVFGEEVPTVTTEDKALSCEEIKRNITAFFNHLDNQEYAESYGLKENSYELFKQILIQLNFIIFHFKIECKKSLG